MSRFRRAGRQAADRQRQAAAGRRRQAGGARKAGRRRQADWQAGGGGRQAAAAPGRLAGWRRRHADWQAGGARQTGRRRQRRAGGQQAGWQIARLASRQAAAGSKCHYLPASFGDLEIPLLLALLYLFRGVILVFVQDFNLRRLELVVE